MNRCKGCYLKQKESLYKCIINNEENKNCPCSICLLKGICKTPCDSFINFLMVIINDPLVIKDFKNRKLYDYCYSRGEIVRKLENKHLNISNGDFLKFSTEARYKLVKIDFDVLQKAEVT